MPIETNQFLQANIQYLKSLLLCLSQHLFLIHIISRLKGKNTPHFQSLENVSIFASIPSISIRRVIHFFSSSSIREIVLSVLRQMSFLPLWKDRPFSLYKKEHNPLSASFDKSYLYKRNDKSHLIAQHSNNASKWT